MGQYSLLIFLICRLPNCENLGHLECSLDPEQIVFHHNGHKTGKHIGALASYIGPYAVAVRYLLQIFFLADPRFSAVIFYHNSLLSLSLPSFSSNDAHDETLRRGLKVILASHSVQIGSSYLTSLNYSN